MWVAAYVSPSRPHIHVLVPKPKPTTTPRSRLSFAISSGNSPPPQAANIFGSVGRTLLTVLEANPKPTTQEEGKEEGVKQISGSDVLWALRKAAAKKNKESGKKNKNKKNSNSSTELSSSSSRARHGGRGGGEEDYTNVRPLRVKSEWSGKLDELEKQLQDLSHTK